MNAMIAATVYCIVGCNTGSPDKDALKVLECDTETGAAKIVQSVNGCEGTTYYQISKDGKTLYSAIGEKRDEKSHGAIVKFDLEGHRIGAMTRLAELPCETPCHIALSPDESVVSFAAYLSGTYGFAELKVESEKFKVEETSTTLHFPLCTLNSSVLPDDAVGPRQDRQKKAYAHQTFYVPATKGSDPSVSPAGSDPAGCLMGVCDLGCDRVNFYDYKKPGGLDKPVLTIKADPGDGPRHAIFSNDGKFLFVVNELSSTVTSYSTKHQAPSTSAVGTQAPMIFTRIGKWSMLPEGCTLKPAETKAAAIKLTADGKLLMASNRGHDSIAFYAVNDGGTLTLKNVAKLTGKFPRDFELMPGEKFMVVGHKMSNEIQVYAFNREKCELKAVGAPIPCWRPLCFKFEE